MNRKDVFDAVNEERERQTEKWGSQWSEGTIPPELKLAILVEEVGEVAREILEDPLAETGKGLLRVELIQTAAVCTAWLESLGEE